MSRFSSYKESVGSLDWLSLTQCVVITNNLFQANGELTVDGDSQRGSTGQICVGDGWDLLSVMGGRRWDSSNGYRSERVDGEIMM